MQDQTDAATEAAPRPTVTFRALGIPEPLLRAVDDLGFERCTPIQQEVLPYTLLGHDCIGKAQTGTGKTAAFLLTIIADLLRNPPEEPRYMGEPRALVIAPTRELVLQIGKDAEELAAHAGLHIVTLIGGMDYDRQRQQLERKLVDILVATPGRLLDFHSQRQIHLDRIEMLVIDEADRMLDMGFIPQVRRIVRQHAAEVTAPDHVLQRHLHRGGHAPVGRNGPMTRCGWRSTPESVASKDIDQIVYLVEADRKLDLLLQPAESARGRQRDDLRQPSRPGATPARAAGTRRHQLRHPLRGSAAAKAREDAGSVPRGQDTACWWPPTWPAAASTSRASRTW